MQQYSDALQHILDNGISREDRTGTGTRSVFGYQMRFDLRKEFPAVTTKKLAWNSVVAELLWFLEGSTDERRLAEIQFDKPRAELIDKTTIWTANANAQGVALGYINNDLQKELGPIYGSQWRKWNTPTGPIDQIATLINNLRSDPYSRRHIVSAWNVADLKDMALPPCHTLFQFYVQNDELSCQLYQRSVDAALGLPYNIASYSLLTHMIAQICNLKVGDFIHTSGDLHLYNNHVDQIKEQLTRQPYKGPTIKMPMFSSLEELIQTKPKQYILENYSHHTPIKMDMAV